MSPSKIARYAAFAAVCLFAATAWVGGLVLQLNPFVGLDALAGDAMAKAPTHVATATAAAPTGKAAH